ncbi:hypothetical protein GCM10017687_30380 [Streptomyces echinatus]
MGTTDDEARGGRRRTLIVSAGMGAGHDTVAAELARRATARGHEAQVADVLRLLPYGLGTGLRRGYRVSVRHLPWVYAGVYGALLREGHGPRPGGVPLARLAGDRLTELVDRLDADAVVSVFHLAAQLTGHLRERGRLRVPSTVFLLDFAVHRQWLHPGNDRYLCLTDAAAARVRRAVGAPVVTTGPVVAPGFLGPAPRGGAVAGAVRRTGARPAAGAAVGRRLGGGVPAGRHRPAAGVGRLAPGRAVRP